MRGLPMRSELVHQVRPVPPDWILWSMGEQFREVNNLTPLVAQWEKSTHPSQQKLYRYLDRIRTEVGTLPNEEKPLFLHLDVDVEIAERMMKEYDLENFLSPLFGSRGFNSSQFVLASAEKKVGGGSSLRIGRAERAHSVRDAGWDYFGWSAATATGWKEYLRRQLSAHVSGPIPDGLVDVCVAWRCSLNRNWVNLWKPTGDAMGPILGEYPHNRNISPRDDRIISLEFHLNVQGTGNAIDVGIWWRQPRATDGVPA